MLADHDKLQFARGRSCSWITLPKAVSVGHHD